MQARIGSTGSRRFLAAVFFLAASLSSVASADPRIVLELDNRSVANIDSADGGSATGSVITDKAAADGVARKHLGTVHYEPIVVQVGGTASKELFQWVADFWAHKVIRKNGAVVSTDFNGREVSRLEFSNAYLIETVIPVFDVSLKQGAARLTMKLQPDKTTRKVGGGPAPARVATTQKTWLSANLRVAINGMDTTRVTKVDAFAVSLARAQVRRTTGTVAATGPSFVQCTNLVLTFAESRSGDFINWHKSFVIEGRHDADQEKTATLVMLQPNLRDTIFTVSFQKVGIFRLTSVSLGSRSDSVRLMRAEMYVNQARLQF
jgi:hypothetical protein